MISNSRLAGAFVQNLWSQLMPAVRDHAVGAASDAPRSLGHPMPLGAMPDGFLLQAEHSRMPFAQQLPANLRPAVGQEAAPGMEALLSEVLGNGSGPVSEEQLFAAALLERLTSTLGAEVGEKFLTLLRGNLGANGSFEEAALAALKTLVRQGELPAAMADEVYSQAFAAAQLDNDLSSLFDARGGPGDDTVATAPRGMAIAQLLERLEDYERGVTSPPRRSLRGAGPTGQTPGGHAGAVGQAGAATTRASGGAPSEGFLWKPSSESTGKLVVLLPSSLGQAESVVLRDRTGRVIEEGDFSGVANGDRAHFRFDRAGGAYPDGLTVEARLADGRTVSFDVPETSQRVEG